MRNCARTENSGPPSRPAPPPSRLRTTRPWSVVLCPPFPVGTLHAEAVELSRQRRASVAHRRHDDLVAATDAAGVDLGAWPKAKILADADAHLAQSTAVAGHRDGVARQPGIGLHEGLL